MRPDGAETGKATGVLEVLVVSDREEPLSPGGEALSREAIIRIVRPGNVLQALHHGVPDGLILDMEPASLGEYRLLYHVQAEYSRIPIVVISRRDLIIRKYLELSGIDVAAVFPRFLEPWRHRRANLEQAVEWIGAGIRDRAGGNPGWRERPAGNGRLEALGGRVFAQG